MQKRGEKAVKVKQNLCRQNSGTQLAYMIISEGMPINIQRLQGGYTMINLIVWLLIGALIGWLASMVMRTDARQGALLNIVVGIVGAMIGGFLLGGPTINSNALNLTALVVSFVGAVILLGIVNLATRGRVR
jgi:uncharacterized membrane protein YeaQ/YmgE (transglycosylase-associated protein family)